MGQVAAGQQCCCGCPGALGIDRFGLAIVSSLVEADGFSASQNRCTTVSLKLIVFSTFEFGGLGWDRALEDASSNIGAFAQFLVDIWAARRYLITFLAFCRPGQVECGWDLAQHSH